jgi:diguanylate cyclase (GGDEF)-like protein/PAS domain S-box-containing protein
VGQEPESDAHGEGFYRSLIDQMSDGVYFVDRQRRISYWSGGAERLTGYAAEEVLSRRCGSTLLNHVDNEGESMCGARCPVMATMQDGRKREAHVYLRHADGHRHPVWVRTSPLYVGGEIVGAVETFGDDTAMRTAWAEVTTLRQAAHTDDLTGLGNRRFLEGQLRSWLSDWARHDLTFGVMFADIDRFKAVNDTYGHDVGDEALALIGRTISHATRAGDVAARYGGEEFVILTHADADGVAAMAERMRRLIAASRLAAARQIVEITVSIGVTMAAPGDSPETLLRRADLALYAAKQAGRNRVECEAMNINI